MGISTGLFTTWSTASPKKREWTVVDVDVVVEGATAKATSTATSDVDDDDGPALARAAPEGRGGSLPC
jgi:hypothetical protein